MHGLKKTNKPFGPHENEEMTHEAVSRACQRKRWRYTPNRKVMLANQKPGYY